MASGDMEVCGPNTFCLLGLRLSTTGGNFPAAAVGLSEDFRIGFRLRFCARSTFCCLGLGCFAFFAAAPRILPADSLEWPCPIICFWTDLNDIGAPEVAAGATVTEWATQEQHSHQG